MVPTRLDRATVDLQPRQRGRSGGTLICSRLRIRRSAPEGFRHEDPSQGRVLAAAVFALLVLRYRRLVTGHAWTPVTDDQLGSALTRVAISVLVGATFGALLFVVFRERAAFAAGNRVVRLCRWPLLVGLGLLVFMFAVPPSVAAQIPEVVRGLIGSLTLLLTFVTAMVIDLARYGTTHSASARGSWSPSGRVRPRRAPDGDRQPGQQHAGLDRRAGDFPPGGVDASSSRTTTGGRRGHILNR